VRGTAQQPRLFIGMVSGVRSERAHCDCGLLVERLGCEDESIAARVRSRGPRVRSGGVEEACAQPRLASGRMLLALGPALRLQDRLRGFFRCCLASGPSICGKDAALRMWRSAIRQSVSLCEDHGVREQRPRRLPALCAVLAADACILPRVRQILILICECCGARQLRTHAHAPSRSRRGAGSVRPHRCPDPQHPCAGRARREWRCALPYRLPSLTSLSQCELK
jgi:hypothetical protein